MRKGYFVVLYFLRNVLVAVEWWGREASDFRYNTGARKLACLFLDHLPSKETGSKCFRGASLLEEKKSLFSVWFVVVFELLPLHW